AVVTPKDKTVVNFSEGFSSLASLINKMRRADSSNLLGQRRPMLHRGHLHWRPDVATSGRDAAWIGPRRRRSLSAHTFRSRHAPRRVVPAPLRNRRRPARGGWRRG